MVLGHPLDEGVGAGADRLEAEILACGFGRLGRDDHAGPVEQLREERGGWLFQHDLDGQWVDDLDAVHGAQLGAAEAAGHGGVAVEGVFHRLRVHFGAVLEQDAGAQLDDEFGGAGPFVAGGELGHRREVFVDVEQLVAHGGEDDTADVGAAERRVEDVGVFAEGDAQGLGVGRAGEKGGEKGGGEGG